MSSAVTIAQDSTFGTHDEKLVNKYTISNNTGLSLTCVDYGATVIGVTAPNRDGVSEEISLNYKNLDDLIGKYGPHFGCLAGRYANRIAGGSFTIDGVTSQLNLNNNGINHLHGGRYGFDTKVWTSRIVRNENEAGVEFTYFSPDGDENYPGNLEVTVTYLVSGGESNEITFTFAAKALDKPTVVNLTNHTYWNLSGNLQSKIVDHTLHLSCDRYLPVTEPAIPTGELASVKDTPFDFTTEKRLGDGISGITGGGQQGIDHAFVVTSAFTPTDSANYQYDCKQQKADKKAFLRHIATLSDPVSGRRMTVHGTQPAVQVYTANFLSKDTANAPFIQHNGVCLETQHFPDSPNQPTWPTTVLRSSDEEGYFHQTVHTFSVI